MDMQRKLRRVETQIMDVERLQAEEDGNLPKDGSAPAGNGAPTGDNGVGGYTRPPLRPGVPLTEAGFRADAFTRYGDDFTAQYPFTEAGADGSAYQWARYDLADYHGAGNTTIGHRYESDTGELHDFIEHIYYHGDELLVCPEPRHLIDPVY